MWPQAYVLVLMTKNSALVWIRKSLILIFALVCP